MERNLEKESPHIFSKFNPLNTDTLSVRITGVWLFRLSRFGRGEEVSAHDSRAVSLSNSFLRAWIALSTFWTTGTWRISWKRIYMVLVYEIPAINTCSKLSKKVPSGEKIWFTPNLLSANMVQKVQTNVKSKAKMVNTTFAYKFTNPCKPVCKCGIYNFCLWFPPFLRFFAPYLHWANLCISRARASASCELKITFSSPEPLGLICNRFPTTWPRNDGFWGRECKDHWKSISWIQCFDIELRYIVKRYWAVLCFVRHARLMVCLLVRASSFSIMLNQRLRRPYFYYCSLNSGAPNENIVQNH